MLRRHQNLSEVNFWAPSAANFRNGKHYYALHGHKIVPPSDNTVIRITTTGRSSRAAIRIDVGLPFNGWRSRVAAAAS